MMFKIILLTLLVFVSSESYNLGLMKDIIHHFHSHWIIFQTCSKTDNFSFMMSKEIGGQMNIYTSIFTWEDFLKVNEWQGNFKPLVILSWTSCPSKSLKGLNDMVNNNAIARYIWFIMTNESASTEFENLKIPINCLFISAKMVSSDFFTLFEIYRMSKHSQLLHFQIGEWSRDNGLIYTKIPFHVRRSNFWGQNITTLTEPENSLNRLIRVYNHFAPLYWDLAKRLNFTIQSITDPHEQHEISIIVQWNGIKTDRVYFPPLYTIMQSIFYKDIGIKLQLDSYMRPFRDDVWYSTMFMILLTGFLSYLATLILSHVSKNKTFPIRLYTYICQSLYIFLQKSESAEVYITQRVITISQWIISICLISCYSATFISFISVVHPRPPFTTIDELLAVGTHNIVTAKHISEGTLESIQYSADIRLRTLYEKHFYPPTSLRDNAIDTLCSEENNLFITGVMHMKAVRSSPEYSNCKISNSYIKLTTRHLSWSIMKGSQYEMFIRFYLQKLKLAGTLGELFNKRGTFYKIPEPDTIRPMFLDDVLILFIIYLVGIIISITIVIFEIIYKNLKQRASANIILCY